MERNTHRGGDVRSRRSAYNSLNCSSWSRYCYSAALSARLCGLSLSVGLFLPFCTPATAIGVRTEQSTDAQPASGGSVTANAGLEVSTTDVRAPAKTPTIKSMSSKACAFLNEGVQFYRVNDFKSAEIRLRQSIAEDSKDSKGSNTASAHYYLANTLVHLGRHEEAIEEFKRTYALDPFGPTSGYCRKALLRYGQQSANTEEASEPLDATTSMLRYAKKSGSAVSTPQQKLDQLRTQAEREKRRHQQFADSYAKDVRATAEGEAQTIRANAKEEIDAILYGRNAVNSPLPWVSQAAQAKAETVRQNADEMEKIARQRAVERAAELKSWSKAKSESLDETVNNLERQLVTKTLPGSPSLRHDGTDLYVRSYTPSVERSPYPPAASISCPDQPQESTGELQ